MELSRFERLKAEITQATLAPQILELEQVIRRIAAEQVAEMALARRETAAVDARQCPRCGCANVVLNGKERNERQRFKCRGCKRQYNSLTGTSMARARKPHLWGDSLRHMTGHLSVRKIAKTGIDLHHVTIWRWRHRFLAATANDNAFVLSGVIEGDETFFQRSFKGSRGWKKGTPPENRAARPRAWGALKRGLSGEQVPVLTALDSAGGVYEAILPSLSDIEAALDGRITAGSVLCSDGAAAYVKAAVTAGAEHRRIITPTVTPTAVKAAVGPTKKRKHGRLGLGHVNAHHGRLKQFINGRCRGVATKYLDNYLGWNRAMMRPDFIGTSLLDQALA
jgi:transposase-like protein